MEQIAINILPKGAKPVCHSSQFDEGRQIMFNLFNDTTPYTLSGTETISVLVRKPDGAEVLDSVTNTSDSYVVWDVSTDACELSGVCECELSIVENGIVLGSKNFTMKVEEDAYGGKNIEVRTASGRIATFSTNMVEAFKSLKSDVNPVQDLHGYSKPWSGGGGKNLLNYEAWKTTSITRGTAVWENNGITLTATANDCYTLTSTDAKIPMSEGETITLSWEETTNKTGQIFIFPNGTTTGMVTVNNGAVKKATYTATSGITFVTFRFGVANSGDTIAYKNIQIEKGSQVTSWEPYENICPISGFSALNVTRTGKNRLNYEAWKTVAITKGTAVWENNGVTLTATANDCYTAREIPVSARIPITEGETITLSWEETTNKSGQVFIFPNGTTTGMVTVNNGAVKKATYTATSGVTFVTFRFGVTNSGDTIAYKNIQIENGNQASDYSPYNGQTATVNFGQTVYGGVADVTNGKVNVTHGIVDLGTLDWSAAGNMWYASLSGVKPIFDTTVPNAICTQYKAVSWVSGTSGTEEGVFCFLPAYNQLRVRDTSYSSASDFKTAVSGVMLCYELATPIEITTTPENLTAIVGQNNVFADTNGDTEVEYYIEV